MFPAEKLSLIGAIEYLKLIMLNMLKCQKVLSVSVRDSHRMQTSKSVLVLTLRLALKRVRKRLAAQPCRQLKARCTSEGREAANLVKIFTTIVSITLLVYHKAEGKRIFSTLGLTLMTLPGTMTLIHAFMKMASYISTYKNCP